MSITGILPIYQRKSQASGGIETQLDSAQDLTDISTSEPSYDVEYLYILSHVQTKGRVEVATDPLESLSYFVLHWL